MRNVPVKTKTVVPGLLVRLSLVFALMGSMISLTINPARASMSSDGYYGCNSGIKEYDLTEDFELTRDQGLTPEGHYLILDGSLWLGSSCGGDVRVSVEAITVQASAFSGNLAITSIFIPADTRVNALANDQAQFWAFAGTENLTTFYYCGEWPITNTGLEGKTWINCPSAPTIDDVWSFGDYTYMNLTPGGDGGSSIVDYTVIARTALGLTSTPVFRYYGSWNGGIQIEIRGLPPETSYTFTVSAKNAYFESVASDSSDSITTSPVDGWYLCESGEYNADQAGHQQSYRIDLGGIVENNGCEGAVIIRPGTQGIEEGFIGSSITSVTIPESVQYLYKAFQDSNQLAQVTFLENSQLEYLGDNSFQGTNLSTITVPSAVETLGEFAFRDASQLTYVNFTNNSKLDFIDYGAFQGTRLNTITIPAEVSRIERGAFIGTISLSSIEVDAANETYRSLDGVLFRAEEENRLYELIKYPQARLGSSYTIPDGTVEIGAGAFSGTHLRLLNIPSTVNYIGSDAFLGTNLISYNFCNDDTDLTDTSLVPERKICSVDQISWESLYRNWQTPLPAITNAPKVGETVWASAFERELPRTLFKEDIAQDPNETSDDYRTNENDYPTPEEYVYRITKQPNVPATSVDHQPYDAYESLTATEQSHWYEEAGLGGENYQFSWNAFMCVSYPDNALMVTKPTGLKYSYASREDGILSDGSLSAAHNLMFKDAAIDWIDAEYGSWQTPRSAVGTKHNNGPYTQAFLGDSDGVWNSFVWGIVDVSASCGARETLEALQIVLDQNTPITTKNFVIPETLNLSHVGNVATDVPSAGITIGVTGGGGAPEYNAALWGLTTIADSNVTPPPTSPPSSPPTTSPTSAPSINAPVAAVTKPASNLDKSIRFSTSSTVLTQAHKNALRKSVKASGIDATYVVTGTAGFLPGVTEAQVKKLARMRATIVRTYLVKLGVNKANISITIKTTNQGIVPKTKTLARFLS